jgi:hypothetical protein
MRGSSPQLLIDHIDQDVDLQEDRQEDRQEEQQESIGLSGFPGVVDPDEYPYGNAGRLLARTSMWKWSVGI